MEEENYKKNKSLEADVQIPTGPSLAKGQVVIMEGETL